ncbi:hypothetical protein [Pseudidiomarina salilacus]|uniref:hypothetical protein n=1 Tax=Pseudidiomarina salilacus TaxID=3384452 RepID=UPI003985161E
MREFLVLALSVFGLSTCYASENGCSYSEASMIENSKEYGERFNISIELIEANYRIDIYVPPFLKDGKFRQAWIVKMDRKNDKELFVFPISLNQENDLLNGWFSISGDLFSDMILYVDYGEDCPFTVKKSIKD